MKDDILRNFKNQFSGIPKKSRQKMISYQVAILSLRMNILAKRIFMPLEKLVSIFLKWVGASNK